jgi:arylsulfatase A-like enzyme
MGKQVLPLCWLLCAMLMYDGHCQPQGTILMLVDDAGADSFSFMGSTSMDTPVIDSLAASSASFTNFFSQPSCAPSRVVLLTGRYAFRTGMYSNGKSKTVAFGNPECALGIQAKEAGYETFYIGKCYCRQA